MKSIYRCILFPQLVQFYKGDKLSPAVSEGYTPENAMFAAMSNCLHEFHNEWVKTDLTWQPSSGIVYSNGSPCGTVFKIY